MPWLFRKRAASGANKQAYERIRRLRELSTTFAQLATEAGPQTLSPSEREAVARYNNWLLERSTQARTLADAWDQALAMSQQQIHDLQQQQQSFDLQYSQLQSQLRNDNRQYAAISHIMKTKHDTVKNSIGNFR